MGSNSSKIPKSNPEDILMLIGIEEVDNNYEECRGPLFELVNCRKKLDRLTTDFVKSMGAESFWETKGDIREAVFMMLSVLSASCKGNLTALGIEIERVVPFIQIENMSLLKSSIQSLLRNFITMVTYLQEIPQIMDDIKHPLKVNADTAEQYTKKVSKMAIRADFSMEDQLEAIRISTINYEIISRAPKERRNLKKVALSSLETIYDAFQTSQYPPHSDLIISRGLQAQADGLTKPKSIISKFWPMVE